MESQCKRLQSSDFSQSIPRRRDLRGRYAHACPEIGRNRLGRVTMSKPVVHLFFLHALAELLEGRGAGEVLDVGSGSGYLTVALARVLADAGVRGSVTGVEVERDLAALGAGNFARDAASAGLPVSFRHEDATRAGAAYDLVVAESDLCE